MTTRELLELQTIPATVENRHWVLDRFFTTTTTTTTTVGEGYWRTDMPLMVNQEALNEVILKSDAASVFYGGRTPL